MITAYQADVVAWANEQAALIRAGKFDQLDLEHIAEEIEDVGKSEQRELASRMSVLLAHLLKWQYQTGYPNQNSWLRTIKEQRKAINSHLRQVPGLKPKLSDSEWLIGLWADAVSIAIRETGLDLFPENCAWDMAEVLQDNWLPTK